MIRLLIDHVRLWFSRGCKHPKLEPLGTTFMPYEGGEIAVHFDACTLCGLTIVSTTP